MLFISRRIGSTMYGVVDTDDGSEEKVCHSDIFRCVTDLGFHIEGVSIVGDIQKRGVKCVVKPYQPPETVTHLQTKTNLLCHVDVKTYKHMITSIDWRAQEFTRPEIIRLSQFGSHIACCVLLDNFASPLNNTPITLMLDDGISSVSPNAFMISGPLMQHTMLPNRDEGIYFDISNVRNGNVADQCYRAIVAGLGGRRLVVIDNPERMQREWRKYGIGL